MNTDKPIVSAVGYIRVSTKEQAEEGYSLLVQERAIEEYCKKNGFELVTIFRDPGKSGRSLDRPGLNNARGYCKKHKKDISRFIIYDLSRLCRGAEIQLAVLAELRNFGIKPESVNEQIDDTAAGKMFTTIVGAFNQFQSDSNGEKTKNTMLELRGKGYPTNRPSIGLKVVRNEEGRAIHVADPPLSEYVIEAFLKMKSGSYAPKELLTHLAETGFKSKKGKNVSLQSFMHMLRSKVYIGQVKVNDEIGWINSDYIDALIDNDTFLQVQAILDSTSRVYKKVTRSSKSSGFPLTIFMKCVCGSKYTGSSPISGSNQPTPYYHCRDKCGSRWVPQEELESAFYGLLQRLQPTNGLMRAYREIVKDVYRVKQGDLKKELRHIEEDIVHQTTIIDNMIDKQFGCDAALQIPLSIFNAQIEARQAKITKMKIKSNALRIQTEQFDNIVDGAFSMLSRVDRAWLNADNDMRRNIQQVVFPDGLIYLGDGKFRTPVTSLAFNILELVEAPESNLVPQTEFEQVGFRPGIGNNIIFLSWVVDSFKL